MSNEFVSISNKSALTLISTVTTLDGTTKTLKVQEGDFLDGLTYLDNGTLKTVSGIVKVIKYSVKTQTQASSLCAHDVVSDFEKRVVPTYLIMDCSHEYESSVLSIPVGSIRDFTSNDLGEMVVSNIRVLDANTVSFICTTTPVAVVWNGESCIPTKNDPNFDIYTINVTTMNNRNVMIVLDTANSSNSTVYGVKPEVIESMDITTGYSTTITNLVDNYYDKYESQDVEISDSNYYVAVANGVGKSESITINDEAFTLDSPIKLSIGKNSFITKPAFNITDGKLYIAAPLLTILADETGKLNIDVNGFDIIAYVNINATSSNITLEGASIYGGKEGFTNTAELVSLPDGKKKILVNRQDGTAAAGWLAHVNGTPISADTLILTKKEYSDGSPTSYGISKVIGNDTITDAIYNYYLDGAIVEPKNRTITYKVVDPLVGSIVFDIEFVESVKESNTDEPSVPSTPTESDQPNEENKETDPVEQETPNPEQPEDNTGSEEPEQSTEESTETV